MTVHALRRQLREQRSMTVNQLGVYRDSAGGPWGRPPASADTRVCDTAASSSDRGRTDAPLQGTNNSQRAVRVLGILFAVFVVFYLPFFVAYTVNGTCHNCYITPKLIVAFEWLQYGGSMVNPIVYHVFNPDFRRAFIKILRCR